MMSRPFGPVDDHFNGYGLEMCLWLITITVLLQLNVNCTLTLPSAI